MTLEQQLFALLEQHDLSSLSLTVLRIGTERVHLYASAQGNGIAASSVGHDDTLTAAQALSQAIGDLTVKRRPPVAEVADLQPMDMAA